MVYNTIMDIFAIIRRSISGAVATALLLVGCAYLVVSTTLLSTDGLNTISNEAGVSQIIRKDMVLPHLINEAEQSSYSHLITKEAVTKAFTSAVPDSALKSKLDPAIESTRDWLDSKSSDISFTIDTSDISEDFKKSLTNEINKNIEKIPACTYENSLSDAEYGVCRSPYIPTSDIKASVADTINSSPAIQLATITTDDFSVPESTLKLTRDIPDYINMLYALSLLTTGIAVIIMLRLLIRHKINGFITIGSICIALSVILFVASLVIPQAATGLEGGQFIQSLATSVADSFKTQLHRQAVSLGGIGVITVLVFGLLKLALSKHRSRRK